jgi:hypothetical protein
MHKNGKLNCININLQFLLDSSYGLEYRMKAGVWKFFPGFFRSVLREMTFGYVRDRAFELEL